VERGQAKLDICVVGSGTGIPNLRRRPPALAVRLSSHLILLDCGAGTLHALAEAGLDFRDLDWLCLSHFHPDHTGDLVPLLFASRSPLFGREKHLTVVGAAGLKGFYRDLCRAFGHWIQMDANLLSFREMDPRVPASLDLPFGRLVTLAMAHTPESLGYRLETRDGLVLAYSGDTDYCANAVSLARNANLFVCECSFPDHLKTDGHLTPKLAGRVAREAHCKRLILTHLYPVCDEVDVVAACRKEYAGDVTVAEDLMWYQV
jgi:ribonuclease BN (tRNA processing enzyme)